MRSLALLPAPFLALVSTVSAQAPPQSSTLPSGLQINYTTPATCTRPTRDGDEISVHYRGTLLSTGALFDESYKRGQPFTFKLGAGQVIAGWDQGLQDMCPGEERKLAIPPALAYGDVNMGTIPPGSTLVFETELMDIVGVKQESVQFASTIELAAVPRPTTTAVQTSTEEMLSIATAPSTPPPAQDEETGQEQNDSDPEATPLDPETEDRIAPSSSEPGTAPSQAECHLLGPFALLVQGALGAMAVLSLVYKRWRETHKRPWRIWFFDVSKQVFGSMLTHILNLAMSMLSSVDMLNAVASAAASATNKGDGEGRVPNPCSFYLLNLAIDTTLGIPVLYILLKILHALFLHTPLANPPESIKSGNYSQPPRASWWAKQLMIYFLGLTGMKLFVFFLFAAMPWLPWIGDWALRWTEGNEALQVTFAMFVFPLAMNAVQYWVIDNFIMDKKRGGEKGGQQGYEAVAGEDEGLVREDEHGSVTEVGDEEEDVDVVGKRQVEEEGLAEVNPTPVDVRRGEGSRRTSPAREEARRV